MACTGQHPWLHPGWKILPTRRGYCSNTYCDRRFRCEDNNVDLMSVQPHYYRVRQVEPCNHLGWSSQALILSILGLGAMPKQQNPWNNWTKLHRSLYVKLRVFRTGGNKTCHTLPSQYCQDGMHAALHLQHVLAINWYSNRFVEDLNARSVLSWKLLF